MTGKPDLSQFPFVSKTREHKAVQGFMTLTKSVRIALGIVLLALVWMLSGVFSGGPEAAKKDAVTKDAPPSVRVVDSIAQSKVNELIIKGRTAAFRNVPIKAETGGRVISIGAEKGALVKKGDLILKLALDDRMAKLDEARAFVRQRQIQYDAAAKLGAKSFASEVRVSEAKALLGAAQSQLSLARLEIDRTSIESPFDGTLADRLVEVGDWIPVGAIVARVADLHPIKIAGQVTENDIGDVEKGALAKIDLLDGRKLTGQITYISPVADPVTRTFAVEMVAPNPSGTIQEGLTAVLRLPLDRTKAHQISPAVLSLDDNGVVGVKTVDAENKARFHPVQVVSDGPEGMWVAGLPDEARIITVGHEFVSAGQVVTPVPAEDVAQ